MINHAQSESGRSGEPVVWQFRLADLMMVVTFFGVALPLTWRLAGYFTSYRQDLGVLVASIAIFLILYGPVMSTILGAIVSRNGSNRMLFWGFVSTSWGLAYLVMMIAHCLQ